MLKLRKNKKGFTLVELIVVIAIMAVLGGVVAGVTVSTLNKNTNKTAYGEIATLVSALNAYLSDTDVDADSFETVAGEWITSYNEENNDALVTGEAAAPKAGSHQFKVVVSGQTITFSFTPKGTFDASRTYTFNAQISGVQES